MISFCKLKVADILYNNCTFRTKNYDSQIQGAEELVLKMRTLNLKNDAYIIYYININIYLPFSTLNSRRVDWFLALITGSPSRFPISTFCGFWSKKKKKNQMPYDLFPVQATFIP